MKRQIGNFIETINNYECPADDKFLLVTKLIYHAYLESNNIHDSKIGINTSLDINNLDSKLKNVYGDIAGAYLPKRDFRTLNSYFADKLCLSSSVNKELYNLVDKLLDLKASDSLLHVNAPDEIFLTESNDYIKHNSLKINGLYLPDNEYAEDLIKMRLVIEDINCTCVENIETVEKFKPKKVFIMPTYGSIDRKYRYSFKKDNLWSTLVKLSDFMQTGSKMVALIPNVLLSNSLNKELKTKLLNRGLIEGIISLPLRYYSKTLKSEVSLVVFSRGNTKIKICDINSIFTVSDVKAAGLDNITEYIIDNYKNTSNYVKPDSLLKKEANMLISNIITKDTYLGITNPTVLSTMADVSKGTKKTKTDFKDIIDQSNESPYCLLSSNDIENGFIDYEHLTRIITNPNIDKLYVKYGDVVITNKSSKVKIAIIDCPDKKILPIGSMIVISPKKDMLDGMYLKMFFESKVGMKILSKAQRGEVTNTLYPEDILKLCIPGLEYTEQIKISRLYKEKIKAIQSKRYEINKLYEDIKQLIKEIR